MSYSRDRRNDLRATWLDDRCIVCPQDEDDDGQLPDAPKSGAVGPTHMAEGASGFTYGGGGYRGGNQDKFGFVPMKDVRLDPCCRFFDLLPAG